MLRELQRNLHTELGDDGYTDYGLMICQPNGRPIMTEYLNKRFKEILLEINDPNINVDNVVFHSIRHTSTSVKLKLSQGNFKSVQGDGGWSSPDMITKRYAHIMSEDRRHLAEQMEASFYQGTAPAPAPQAQDVQAALQLLIGNPELLAQVIAASTQKANDLI